MRLLYLLKPKNRADEKPDTVKHRKVKEMNLTECNWLVGLLLASSVSNSPEKSNVARIILVLPANLMAATEVSGNCQSSLLLTDLSGVKAVSNAETDITRWVRDAFHVAALHFEPPVLAGKTVAKALGDRIFLAPSLHFLSC